MTYIHRVIEPILDRYVKAFPVVGLTGPRQAGKSTLLKNCLSEYIYVTFDDHKNIQFLTEDPDGFFEQYKHHIIFDEVQYVPEIFNLIKIRVDDDRSAYGKFILTGSSQFQFLQHVTESLAGRIGLLSLLPFQYSEIFTPLRIASIYKGGYPELVIRDYIESDAWFGSYVETYLSKDVRALSNIGDLRDFRRFIQLLAANVTQQLDMSTFARDLGISVPTVKRWISVLEASYIIFTLPPYYENFGKRITKSPKVYFYDTGLISYLTGITTKDQYEKGPLAGSIFENYIISEIKKKELHTGTLADLYYFRTYDKAEIDLIVDRRATKDFIEIKKSVTFLPKQADTLLRYAPESSNRFVLYNGDASVYKGIQYANYKDYL